MIFTEAPKDFQKEIDVVACYIQHADKFVLLQRNPDKAHGTKWGLPAGKIDAGETMHKAMQREIFEETALRIPSDNLQYYTSLFVRNEGHDLEYHMFSIDLDEEPTIQINPYEHQDFKWVTPPESQSMDLVQDQDECNRLFYKL